MAFLLPGYATYLKRNIPENILSSAFLTSTTIISLCTFLISLLIITPIYDFFGVRAVFIFLTFVMMFALALVYMPYYRKNLSEEIS